MEFSIYKYNAVHSQVRQPIRHSHHMQFTDTRPTYRTSSPSFAPKSFPIKARRSISAVVSKRYFIIPTVKIKVYVYT